MSLSTHVLDAAAGRPAAGLAVRLERREGTAREGTAQEDTAREDTAWTAVAESRTDADGRITGWASGAGVHRLVFDTGGYLGPDAFYPEVAVTFRITDPGEHHHVPLLLSPFAYSTYRGS